MSRRRCAELYQEVILDHSKRPRNFHGMPEANRQRRTATTRSAATGRPSTSRSRATSCAT